MNRPRVVLALPAGWLVATLTLYSAILPAHADEPVPSVPRQNVPGQFFPVVEPITSETLVQLRVATKQFVDRHAAKGVAPILVFEFQSGEVAPETSEFGVAFDLAELISKKLGGAGLTVAYIPHPLRGNAVLPALACDQIVMGSDATLGPITLDGQAVDPDRRALVRGLATRKGADPELYLGLLDPRSDLHLVRTAEKRLQYVPADKLDEFRATHQVVEDLLAWDESQRGVLTAARAREQNFARLIADTPAEVAHQYNLAGQSASNDPTLGHALKPVWIRIQGPIDAVKRSYLSRRIDQARQEEANLLFFQIDSIGGIDTDADALADLISGIQKMKTVAFIDDRATGVSALLALACNDIVFRKGAQMGDVHRMVTGRRGESQELDRLQTQALSGRAANLAEQKGHPPAVARAMVDPDVVLIEAKDAKTGAACFVLQSQVEAEPNRYLEPEVRKEAGQVLTITGEEAVTYGLGQVVNAEEDFKGLYGLRGKPIRVNGPTWVDHLVTILTDPFVSWLLLFVGLFMLVLELKLPGIGLPAITSALAFLLFFWSHYLSGTADQLEIILFLVGMVCLALELFVFPGFGVFGMSGVLLILTSIVMASHTFVWPTQEYEYREMGFTLLQVMLAMVAVAGGALVVARYLPSLPLLNRLVLKAEPWTSEPTDDPLAKPSMEGYESLAYLVGETGRTTTVLRPSGKAKFGELLLDVRADGAYIEPDRLVEVIDVQGSTVIVKQVGI